MAIASRDFRELRLERISRDFGQVHALRDVSLTVKRGEFVALLGPSGCGKSTALNCIAGLLQLTDGAIWLDERRLDELGPEDRGFGMVFQNYALFPHMTVRRNIGFGLVTQRRPKAEIDAAGRSGAGAGAAGDAGRQAARPAVRRPAAAGRDRARHRGGAAAGADGRAAVQPRRQAAAGDARRDPAHPHELGCSTIYVTHDQEEALSLADRIVVMIDGQTRQIGTPEELYARPAHADVAEFMGYRNLVAVAAEAADGGIAVAIGGARLHRHADGGGRRATRWRRSGPMICSRAAMDRSRRRWRSPNTTAATSTRWRAHDGTELYFRSDRRVAAGEAVAWPRRRARAGLPRMSAATMSLRRRLRERGIDGVTLLVLPGVVFVLALFVYPFLYGLVLSFTPKEGGWLANYQKFFSDPFLYDTICLTLQIAVPVTLLNTVLSVPVALRVRLMKRQRLLTTILVIPITLGTVMVAEGLLTYLGPRGWLNRVLMEFGIADSPIRLVHNYWGVMLSLVISGFPFTFLLTLSYVTGIDPSLEQAGAMLGARARQRFFRILLPLLAPGLAITLACPSCRRSRCSHPPCCWVRRRGRRG